MLSNVHMKCKFSDKSLTVILRDKIQLHPKKMVKIVINTNLININFSFKKINNNFSFLQFFKMSSMIARTFTDSNLKSFVSLKKIKVICNRANTFSRITSRAIDPLAIGISTTLMWYFFLLLSQGFKSMTWGLSTLLWFLILMGGQKNKISHER